MKRFQWNRCDDCGRYIGWMDFAKKGAIRRMVSPDSFFGPEEYETLCKRHYKRRK